MSLVSADPDLCKALLPLFIAGGAYDKYVGDPVAPSEAIRSAVEKVGKPALAYLKNSNYGPAICLSFSNAAFTTSLAEYTAVAKQNLPGFMKVKAKCSDTDPTSKAYRIMAASYRAVVVPSDRRVRSWFAGNCRKDAVVQLARLFLLNPPTEWAVGR